MGVHQESCKERKIAIILKLVRMNFFIRRRWKRKDGDFSTDS